jgi:hypothetical protein
MSRHQRHKADTAVMDLNALAASCNAACGGGPLLWEKGEGVHSDLTHMAQTLDLLRHQAQADRPGLFADFLGVLVFDALSLAGALGIDVAAEVERERKRQEKVGG